MADAGLFHMAIPRAIGGGEIDLPTYIQVIEEIGKADASTGWCLNQGAIFGTYAARMPRAVARTIWADVPRAVVANTPAATAKAIVVPGGYRVTSPRAARVQHRLPARIVGRRARADHRERSDPHGRQRARGALHVRAGRGGGAARHLAHPRHARDGHAPLRGEGRLRTDRAHRALADGPAHRGCAALSHPRTLLFASGDAAVAFGMSRTCLETFGELAGAKTPRAMPTLLREQPMIQLTVGQAEAALRSGRAFLHEAVREAWAASVNNALTLEHRANLRLATTHGIRLAAQIIDSVYNAAGATAAYEDHLLQRHFQDIHVITQHLQGRPRPLRAGRPLLARPQDRRSAALGLAPPVRDHRSRGRS